MIWLAAAIGAAAVVAVAFVAVGAGAARLEHETAPTPYSLPDAVQYAAGRLPEEVASRVGYDDVRAVIERHLDWFAEAGLGAVGGNMLGGRAVTGDGETVVEADGAINAVVARSLEADGPGPVDVVCILEVHCEYLVGIGALTEGAVGGSAASAAGAQRAEGTGSWGRASIGRQ